MSIIEEINELHKNAEHEKIIEIITAIAKSKEIQNFLVCLLELIII